MNVYKTDNSSYKLFKIAANNNVTNQLVIEKLVSDMEKFIKEFSVKEVESGLLITTKL